MKHIKLFENYNGETFTKELSDITPRLNLEPFTKNELEFIYDNKGKLSMNASSGSDVWRESSWFGHKFKKFFNNKNFKYISLFSPFNSGSIEICKSSDEWYYVKYGNFYKCDQLDGLIDCIQYCISLHKFKPKIAK